MLLKGDIEDFVRHYMDFVTYNRERLRAELVRNGATMIIEIRPDVTTASIKNGRIKIKAKFKNDPTLDIDDEIGVYPFEVDNYNVSPFLARIDGLRPFITLFHMYSKSE